MLLHKDESPIAILSDIKKHPGEYEDLDLINEDGQEEIVVYGDNDPSLNVPDTYVTRVQDPVKKKKVPVAPVLPPPVGKKPRVGLVNVQESVSWTKDSDQEQCMNGLLETFLELHPFILNMFSKLNVRCSLYQSLCIYVHT